MPTVNIPPKVRFGLYLLSALGSVGVAYLASRGLIGEAETAAWAGVVAIINGLAAANTNLSGDPVVKVRQAVVEGDPEDTGAVDVVTVLVVALVVVLILVLVGVIR